MDWFKRLISDSKGDPNEHIIAAILGTLGVFALAGLLVYLNHPPTLIEFGAAHGAVWTAGGIGQKLSSGS